MSKALTISQRCGRWPLLVGVGIFITWLIAGVARGLFDSVWADAVGGAMMLLGLGVLCIGPLFFVIGTVALGVHVWRGGDSTRTDGRRIRRATLASGTVLVANFVVAGLILWLVVAIDSRFEGPEDHGSDEGEPSPAYTVLIHNTSGNDLTQASIVGSGQAIDLGTLEAGAWDIHYVFIEEAGTIHFTAEGPEAAYAVNVDQLGARARSDWTTLTLLPGGEFTLRPQEVW